MENSVKFLRVPATVIIHLLKDPLQHKNQYAYSATFQKIKNIPQGVVVLTVVYEDLSNSFLFKIHHPDFDTVPLKDSPPIIDAEFDLYWGNVINSADLKMKVVVFTVNNARKPKVRRNKNAAHKG